MDIPKVFVISPNAFKMRREITGKHLNDVGLNPTFFSGLNGAEVKLISGWNNPHRPFAKWMDQTPNMLCCSLNHWFLWQHVVLAGLESAIIFEDDVYLPDDFLKFYERMIAQTPNDWEMIYMSILYPENIHAGKLEAHVVGDGVFKFDRAASWDGTVNGLHAYVISQSAARKFCNLKLDLVESMDRWISFHGLPFTNTYIWNPSPITQHSDRSGKGTPAPEEFKSTVYSF